MEFFPLKLPNLVPLRLLALGSKLQSNSSSGVQFLFRTAYCKEKELNTSFSCIMARIPIFLCIQPQNFLKISKTKIIHLMNHTVVWSWTKKILIWQYFIVESSRAETHTKLMQWFLVVGHDLGSICFCSFKGRRQQCNLQDLTAVLGKVFFSDLPLTVLASGVCAVEPAPRKSPQALE